MGASPFQGDRTPFSAGPARACDDHPIGGPYTVGGETARQTSC